MMSYSEKDSVSPSPLTAGRPGSIPPKPTVSPKSSDGRQVRVIAHTAPRQDSLVSRQKAVTDSGSDQGRLARYSAVSMGQGVSCVEEVEELCNTHKASPRDKVATAAQVSASTFELGNAATPYGTGFGQGSDGPQAGVRSGDILAQIDGNMVLGLKSVNGKHPAQDLMMGTKNTVCELKLLRVEETDESKRRRESFNSGGSPAGSPRSSHDLSDDIKLIEVTCAVKRLVPMRCEAL